MKQRKALRPESDLVDLLFAGSKLALLMHKQSQFRRHRDWRCAFKKVVPQFMKKLPDGSEAIHERDMERLFERTDQEFIDEIIRRGG